MKTPGLVTIMMPVLNGELFIPMALDSLLAQEYTHFEIIILDNQSTDRTPAICRDYEGRDKRVKYVLDTVNRISHDAANHLASFITGEFCMIACDDDLWAPNFLTVLVSYLKQNPKVGLAFPNACYVDVEGNRGAQRLLSARHLYTHTDASVKNVWRYLGQRRVVPTIFGVYRSEAYLAALPFDTFDETIADVDNLFLIKLLLQTKVQGIDEVLFFYRNKFRGYNPGTGQRWSDSWSLYVGHQWRFLRKILDVCDQSRVSNGEGMLLKFYACYTFALMATFGRVRSRFGKTLVQLRLREGPTVEQDIHAEIRSTSLRSAHAKK
jgi:glycosyltransferase involved in cell wall biosynthesis